MTNTIEIKKDMENKRRNGYSISQIHSDYPNINKSRIYDWVRYVPLSNSIKNELKSRGNKQLSSLSNSRKSLYIKSGKELAKQQRNNKLFISGCALYWAEGTKNINMFGFANCDWRMHAVMMEFIKEFFPNIVPKIKFSIHVYKEADIEEVKKYWSDNLDFEINFTVTIVKN